MPRTPNPNRAEMPTWFLWNVAGGSSSARAGTEMANSPSTRAIRIVATLSRLAPARSRRYPRPDAHAEAAARGARGHRGAAAVRRRDRRGLEVSLRATAARQRRVVESAAERAAPDGVGDREAHV